jgi:hypothetical protein
VYEFDARVLLHPLPSIILLYKYTVHCTTKSDQNIEG